MSVYFGVSQPSSLMANFRPASCWTFQNFSHPP
jgi:hypothetical protein